MEAFDQRILDRLPRLMNRVQMYAVLGGPGIPDDVLAAEPLDPMDRLGILQHRNDLFFCVPFPCHAPRL